LIESDACKNRQSLRLVITVPQFENDVLAVRIPQITERLQRHIHPVAAFGGTKKQPADLGNLPWLLSFDNNTERKQ
jgi:hypothetical protein